MRIGTEVEVRYLDRPPWAGTILGPGRSRRTETETPGLYRVKPTRDDEAAVQTVHRDWLHST